MRFAVRHGPGKVRRGQGRDAADAVMAKLVPLVLDDAWTAVTAASQLRRRPYDEADLRRARARVLSASPARASHVAERVVATLDLALGSGPIPREHLPARAAARPMDGRR